MAHVRKQMISFFMTTRCNLNCIYCYTPKYKKIRPEDQTIDLEFAKRGITDFFRDSASRYIRFYGIGEPTLEFDKIVEIRNFAYSLAKESLTVELQTNGCFSEMIRSWIEDNVDVLWISCDGMPEIQDKQRPFISGAGTSGIVEENLRYLTKCDRIQTGVRATLTSEMIARQRELVDYLSSLGVKYINVLPTFAPEEGSNSEIFVWDPIDFAKSFYDAHMYAKSKGIWYNTMCIVNFDEKTRIACRSCTPCPHLTTDGFVSCCDFTQLGYEYISSPLSQLIYGQYDRENDRILYNEDAISKIRSRCTEKLAQSTCKDCEYLENCAGGCMGQVVNETGDLMGRCEDNCKIVRYLGERMERNNGLHPAFHS